MHLNTWALQLMVSCPLCQTETGQQVWAGITQDLGADALRMGAPFAFCALLALIAHQALRQRLQRQPSTAKAAELLAPGLCLGMGLTGFFDGILFHQILQVHSMMSGRLFPDTLVRVDVNMFWDGIFHAGCLALVVAGLVMLWRAQGTRSTRTLLGALCTGGGIFNLGEGCIDHQLMGLHHVVERAVGAEQLAFDVAFLASGALLIGLGVWLTRGASQALEGRHVSSPA